MQCQSGFALRRHDVNEFGLGLDGVCAGPGVISAQQSAGVKSQHTELARHTGAGGLIGSRAVGHHPTMFRCRISLIGPLMNLVGQHADTTGYLPI